MGRILQRAHKLLFNIYKKKTTDGQNSYHLIAGRKKIQILKITGERADHWWEDLYGLFNRDRNRI